MLRNHRQRTRNSKMGRACVYVWSVVSDPLQLHGLCSLPGSSVHGISQARILEWVAISFPRESFWSRGWTLFSCIAGRFFTALPLGVVHKAYSIIKCWLSHLIYWLLYWKWETDGLYSYNVLVVYPSDVATGSWGCCHCPASQAGVLHTASPGKIKIQIRVTSLVVQWLGFHLPK